MSIKTALEKYKILGDYFAPDYERDNDVLNQFKESNPNLSRQQTNELVDLINNSTEITDKYFVADLLYLYDNFDKDLLEPLINTAINHKDPSFNRVFLRPCIMAFGVKAIADNLAEKFDKVSIEERIGISNLVYWLNSYEKGDVDKLYRTILERANKTTNLIELYHYKRLYTAEIIDGDKIPNTADELINAIAGQKEYEDLLFGKLGWIRTIPVNTILPKAE